MSLEVGIQSKTPPLSLPNITYHRVPEDVLALWLHLDESAGVKKQNLRCRTEISLLLVGGFGWFFSGAFSVFFLSSQPWIPMAVAIVCLLVVGGPLVLAFVRIATLLEKISSAEKVRQQFQIAVKGGSIKTAQVHVLISRDGLVEIATTREELDGVVVENKSESRAGWSAIGNIDITDKYAFCMFKEAGCLILPKRAFANEEGFRSFLDQLMRHQRSEG